MVWGILGALDEEIRLIREKMLIENEYNLYGTCFYVGTISGKKVVVAVCGIGKVNASACASLMYSRFAVDLIVNVGIAGAMAKGLNILDVVLSEKAVFHDQDSIMLKYYPNTEYFIASEELLNKASLAIESLGDINYIRGTVASGDVFVNDKAVKDAINEKYHPACVEMEGAAIAHISFMNNKPFLIIRTMSDSADDNADTSYDNFIEIAAIRSANIILKMLSL